MINISRQPLISIAHFLQKRGLWVFLLLFPVYSTHAQTNHPASQQELNSRASEAMKIGNYAIAFCIWQPMALNDDTNAQFNLGWMYHNGYGLRIDDEQAFYWWLRAATKGHGDAHFALGDLYATGQGVDKSQDIALGWYISAAMKEHQQARETLAGLLKNKPELTRDIFRILLKTDWQLLGNNMQVRVEKANTRSGPDKSYKVITTLDKGHIVIPIAKKDGWTKIGITGIGETAWIFSSLLEKAY